MRLQWSWADTKMDHQFQPAMRLRLFGNHSARLYGLPKEIAEMPRVEAPGPRRDEGVDEHPRPRNNAGTRVSTAESEFSCPRSGTSSLPPTIPFLQELSAICMSL